MKFGLSSFITDYTVQPDELARKAEERGFESLWLPEHTHIPADRRTPYPAGGELPREYYQSYDPFVALTAAAAVTRELRLATGICLIIQRDPITTAKTIATLDRVSNGRFIFGIGGGWNAEEIANHGTAFKTRFRLLRERVLAMKAMWTEETPQFHGQFVDFDPMYSNPKPVQKPHPPVIMGGDGPTTFDRVIQFCDGWLPNLRGKLSPELGDKIQDLRRRAEAAGRDPDGLSISLFGFPPDAEALQEAERLGVERVILGLPARSPDESLPRLDEYARLVR